MPNTQQIDAQIAKRQEEIQKLEALKQMASDPEMLTLMKSFITANGTGRSRRPHQRSARAPKHPQKKGDLQNGVVKTIASSATRFTAPGVVDLMKRGGFIFAAGKPNIAVNSVLRKLVTKGILRIAVEGSGRRPNQYEHIKKGN